MKADIKAIITVTNPHLLKVGDKISFQEGATVVGYAEVLDVINDILKA